MASTYSTVRALYLFLVLLSCLALSVAAASKETAYDKGGNVFSPSGRLIQLDYAAEAVKRGSTCYGAQCSDGVVLAMHKPFSQSIATKMLVSNPVRRIYSVGSSLGLLAGGLSSDGREVAQKAMSYNSVHKEEYGDEIRGRVLAEKLSSYLHRNSLDRGSRPLATAILLACPSGEEGEDSQGVGSAYELWSVDVYGVVQKCRACCVGTGAEAVIETWLEGGDADPTCKSCKEFVASLAEVPHAKEGRWEITILHRSPDGRYALERQHLDKESAE